MSNKTPYISFTHTCRGMCTHTRKHKLATGWYTNIHRKLAVGFNWYGSNVLHYHFFVFFYVNTQRYLVYTDHTGNCTRAHTHTYTHMNKATKNVHTKSSVKETTKSQNECIPQLYTNLSIAYIMSDQCFCKVSNI